MVQIFRNERRERCVDIVITNSKHAHGVQILVAERFADKIEQGFSWGIVLQAEALVELRMIRLPGGKALDRNAGVLECHFQALRLGAGIRMVRYVQDEKWRNVSSRSDMSYRGIIVVLGWIVAKL